MWLRNHVVRCRKALLPECPLLLTHHTTQTTQQKEPCTEDDDKHERNMLLADGLLSVLQKSRGVCSSKPHHRAMPHTSTLARRPHYSHTPSAQPHTASKLLFLLIPFPAAWFLPSPCPQPYSASSLMATFVAFTVGAGAASACLYEASLALDQYATAANPRRYTDKGLSPIRGPSSINLSVCERGKGGEGTGVGREALL